ncbi:galactose mutarotase-like protein [Cryphonectria parasitica EP155]|uniref:Glucose-6-phosphate 1-epimerase n=1 Tax=Cryphonectria parasitica (strain ATCC 38755 / EP155) TaxID=660469 RepID=A0A9P5CMH5_CRYP1|nr:galactose mutarotase-like protein [Cryphonectria parasitica EP155]KAF3764389.1 galactose mutarotase-like protein [Cryphonectria parasitica EP155]
MVDRPNKPSALASTPQQPIPQASVNIDNDTGRVSAQLPTGESVEVLLHGATVISWKDASGNEKLWLSEKAVLDGSKAVRGGIPLVFPVFGTAPDHAATSKLPQHGFARTSRWELLGKSTSESKQSDGSAADTNVKLDFGLSSSSLDDKTRALWPYDFDLIYSVTLERSGLNTSIVITNKADKAFEFEVLLHTYLRVKDITQVAVDGLDASQYIDKVDGASTKTQSSSITITGETDRVYTPAQGPSEPVIVTEGGSKIFSVVRDNLTDVVVWNPWTEKAAGIGDFAPKDGFKQMICVEAGSVKGFQTLEPGDAFEGAQTITAL